MIKRSFLLIFLTAYILSGFLYADDEIRNIKPLEEFMFKHTDHNKLWTVESIVLDQKSTRHLKIDKKYIEGLIYTYIYYNRKAPYMPGESDVQLYTRDMKFICKICTVNLHKNTDPTEMRGANGFFHARISNSGIRAMINRKIGKGVSFNRPFHCIFTVVHKESDEVFRAQIPCTYPVEIKNRLFFSVYKNFLKKDYKSAEVITEAQNKKKRMYCYTVLGDLCFENREIRRAEKYFRIIRSRKRFKKLADYFFDTQNYKKAEEYYIIINDRQGFDKLGRYYYNKKKYLKAAELFDKTFDSEIKAYTYHASGDLYLKNNETLNAKKFYIKADKTYKNMIRNIYHSADHIFDSKRVECLKKLKQFSMTPREKEISAELRQILFKSAYYCNNLVRKFKYFYCIEDIDEFINLKPNASGFLERRLQLKRRNRKYRYDYQIVKQKGKIRESRILLKEEGKKQYRENAKLKTVMTYSNLIFGPTAFLSKKWQQAYEFEIIKKKIHRDKIYYTIEAVIKRPSECKDNALAGKIYITEGKHLFDINKIEWNPKGLVKDIKYLIKLEKKYKKKLTVNFFSELKVRKKGYSLPSRYYLEISYTDNKGNKVIRTTLNVKFRKHKFFSVNTDKLTLL